MTKHDALRMRVHVEAVVAHESEETLIALLGKIDRQTAGSANGGDDCNARRKRLLQDLKARPAADLQNVLIERLWRNVRIH